MSDALGSRHSFIEYINLAKQELKNVQTAHPELDRLTKREIEVFTQLLSDKSQSDIARELFITPSSVHFHCKNIYKKLEVSGRRQLILRYKDLLE
ncbi:MAG: helix-turn-helix transcriptional regulator [Clostridiales bacterium]|nr:helix-turn-helix transcriptional regulator [Clostridiales bacterium]